MKVFYKTAFMLTFVLLLAGFASAQSDLENGIALYKQGRNKEASACWKKPASKRNFKPMPKFLIISVWLMSKRTI